MELISVKFMLFLAALLGCYYGAGKLAPKAQWVVLLAASLGFYGLAGNWEGLVYILVTALITWAAGLGLDALARKSAAARKAAASRDERKAIRKGFDAKRRAVLVAALLACFAILAYHKYWNVFLAQIGLASSPTSLGILLPLGMSFYIFQSTGYVIDVYNERTEPERNFAHHLLFVSFFPQLIQGPINHHAKLAHQLFETHAPELRGMRRGALRFAFGAFKKLTIANTLSSTVALAFANIDEGMPGALALYGVLCYSLQMYADFSGGIDMVEGVAELLGIEMEPNFRQPYLSTSLSVFWQRWHMSLGAWMRDYVFYPLALTRPMKALGKWAGKSLGRHAGRTLPACVANIIVFVLVGVWHGIEGHFIAWGLYNGIVIALSDLLSPAFAQVNERLGIDTASRPWRIFAIIRTFIVVNIGRYFDIIPRVGDAFIALRNTVTNFLSMPLADVLASANAMGSGRVAYLPMALAGFIVVMIVDIRAEAGRDVRSDVLGLPLAARIALYLALGTLALACFTFVSNGGGGFLYANF